MKLVLLVLGGIGLAGFSALHVFIAYEHSRQLGPQAESVLAPALMALVTAGIAVWVFRRALRAKPAA